MIRRVFSPAGAPIVLYRDGSTLAYTRSCPVPAADIPMAYFRAYAYIEEGAETEWLTAVLAERWDPKEYSRKEQD